MNLMEEQKAKINTEDYGMFFLKVYVFLLVHTAGFFGMLIW